MTAELVVAPTRPSLPDKITYARELADSGLLPTSYRKQPANLLYAIEYGEMLNLSPMAAVTGIHVIEGKPTASAALISALVRRAGHRLRITGDSEKAIAEIVRCDDPDFTFRSEWTAARAQTADLLNKKVWKQYRPAMLKARAITECARDACEEALMGMAYTPEEMGVDVDEDGIPLRTQRTSPITGAADAFASTQSADNEPVEEPDWEARLTQHEQDGDRVALVNLWKWAKQLRPDDGDLMGRITAAGERLKAAQSAAPADEPIDAEVVDPPPDDTAQPAGNPRMFALLTEAGLGGNTAAVRDRRLKLMGNVLNRPVASSKELTYDDRQNMIAALERWKRNGDLERAEQVAQEEAAMEQLQAEGDTSDAGTES